MPSIASIRASVETKLSETLRKQEEVSSALAFCVSRLTELPLEIQEIQRTHGQPDVVASLQDDLARFGVMVERAKVQLAECAEFVSWLQSSLSDVELSQIRADNALSKVAMMGRCGDVQEMLDVGARVTSTYEGKTALHFAAWKGHDQVAKLLLANDSDVNARDADGGYTPLHFACLTNVSEEVVARLLRAGANDLALTVCGRTAESLLGFGHEGARFLLHRVAERRRWAWVDLVRKRADAEEYLAGRSVRPRRSGRLAEGRAIKAVKFLVLGAPDGVFHAVMRFLC